MHSGRRKRVNVLSGEDRELLKRVLDWARAQPELDDNQAKWFEVFQEFWERYKPLTERQRAWLKGVADRLEARLEPDYVNAWSAGKVPRKLTETEVPAVLRRRCASATDRQSGTGVVGSEMTRADALKVAASLLDYHVVESGRGLASCGIRREHRLDVVMQRAEEALQGNDLEVRHALEQLVAECA